MFFKGGYGQGDSVTGPAATAAGTATAPAAAANSAGTQRRMTAREGLPQGNEAGGAPFAREGENGRLSSIKPFAVGKKA